MEYPIWLKEMMARPWGVGAVKESNTKKGKSLVVYVNGFKSQVEDGDYIVNWFGIPMRMGAGYFNNLFEEKSNGKTAKNNNSNT